MELKKLTAALCAACLCLTLGACSDSSAVYVQSVEALMRMGGIAPGDRFVGVVVSENVTEIQKDSDKSVKELPVKEGDDVKEGQALFSYDTDQLQLNLDKQKLELTQMHATIDSYNAQINTLQQQSASATGTTKLQYTIEIQSTQLDLKEAQLRLKAKETEVQKAEELLENATVVSPVSGRIQSINSSGTDSYGNPAAFITIQQVGSYRIKGTLGELQRGGIVEGDRLTIRSRTDDTVTWSGTVTLVDYESPTQGNEFDRYYGGSSNEMTSSSKYPFYVQPDNTEGLILGQHIYMERETEEAETAGPSISSAFICYEEDGTAYVWAESNGKLKKRVVTLGEYNPMADLQEISDGLTVKDYIAFPDPELCVEGAPTTREQLTEPESETVEEGIMVS